MTHSLTTFLCLILQTGAPPASVPAAPAADPAQQNFAQQLLPMLTMGGLCFLVFYLLIIRPQRRQQQQHAAMLDALKKNDTVRTTGGILGKVAAIEKERNIVVLKIDEQQNVRMRVLRSAIEGVIQEEKPASEKEAAPHAAAASAVPTK
ncbi:MAG: preprotein translocase subunit YajC [Planctomycetes bacterium]|nr:preprotein translocase subunit YajC [Planctomycetota bacterium]